MARCYDELPVLSSSRPADDVNTDVSADRYLVRDADVKRNLDKFKRMKAKEVSVT